ncbi:flagellar hook-associated protein FlgL [Jeotgalibacillus sp. S-D1]|uniref:flagellar hook-associated protein FlgL n=1 Tax=Jeotgalibacillus sp. S-D1 TaxID=2552189 RepID=UPI00105AAD7F|nr:flagellar hook-associated protein FlgL [Jeotgalibacillus sp. S-D1]TDL32585.1 flagellar hook-associated protein FlgL [Jeotgalibacillus sp. S-D1]
MRVTQSMLTNHTIRQISTSYSKLQVLQDQLTSGKKITRPSQDPVTAMNGLRYRAEIAQNRNYLDRHVGEAYQWIESADNTLDKVNLALQRARELTVQASNDTYTDDQRFAIAAEIDQLTEHIGALANTKVNNKYLFNGRDTSAAPFNMTSLSFEPTNNESIEIEVMKGITIGVNVKPSDAFDSTMFSDLQALSAALKEEQPNGNISSFVSKIDSHASDVMQNRSILGAKYNRVEMMEQRLSQEETAAARMMSENEDIDMEKVLIELTSQEALHRASLSAGSRIIQPTLVDFLR